MFADVVNAHVGRGEQTGHAGGVDQVTAPTRVGLGGLQHHGGEQTHAMHHAFEVDAQHPIPIGFGVLPHQSTGGHTSVVEHQMRRTPLGPHILGQGLHLPAIGHIHAACHHRGTGGLQFSANGVEGVFLHVHQGQFHPQLRTQAGQGQTKTRTSAGDDRGFSRKVFDHAPARFNTKPMRGKCTCTVPARGSVRRMV